MEMPDSDVFRASPERLAAVLGLGDSAQRVWGPEELGAVFEHQMRAPVSVDLGAMDARVSAKLRMLTDAQGLMLKSFADLFEHPHPPLELLRSVKDFGKLNRDQPESLLPNEVAAALYYLSIAAALARLGERISSLSDSELRQGFDWTLAQPWISGARRKLVEDAQRRLPGPVPSQAQEQ
jgi:hypothetical protein